MAEFALGLTKTAVEGTVSRVKLAIEEEAKLNEKVQNDLVFIMGEFEMMQAFLKVANSERAKNEVVRTWVRQLRTLAFDVEDCVEFIVHLDKKSIWGWLPRLWHMVYCGAPPLPLDMAISEIELLKARVEDVSQRNTRYNLIMDSSSTGKPALPVEQPTPATTGASALHVLRGVWEATRKWCGMGDLKKLVSGEGNELQVISIWDSSGGDLGTKSIFSNMYNDQAICEEFESRAWVKLNHPFNPDECLKSMLTQFCASSHQANIDGNFRKRMKAAVAMEDDLMKAQLMHEVMRGHKYIIILEDVPSVVEWDVIKMYLPDNENGSRIILSTKQLRVALLCTGEPYQVSELAQFSHDQSLCAFSKKCRRRSGISELIWQIRCRGVISVCGSADRNSILVNKVYNRIVHKSKQFEGVEFERHSWVDVPIPFNLEVFSRRLLLSLRSEDLVAEEIAAVGIMRDPCLTQECSKFLHEDDCLVIINGLQCTNDWDSIKAALSPNPTEGCILVITNEASVATHCAEEEGVLNTEDMEADTMLHSLIKGFGYYGSGGTEASDRGRHFFVRKEQAREWLRKLGDVYWDEMSGLETLLDNPGVVSLWGIADAGKSTLVRSAYYRKMVSSEGSYESGYEEQPIHLQDKTSKFSWVDVSHPFNLADFSCSLFLDFHSDDIRSKKAAAVSMMEGQDPIQGCCKFLCENECFIVIDGLGSTHDWDLIKDNFLSKPIKGSIVVITQEAIVATYCVNHEEDRVMNITSIEFDQALGTPVKGLPSHLFSNRREEARNWTNKFRLLGKQNDSAHRFANSLSMSGPSVTSVWGIAGIGKSSVVRSVYCHLMIGLEQYLKYGDIGHVLVWSRPDFTKYIWADVPHPFNLADLSWLLLQDFYSDDLHAKSTAAIRIMEGQDPIQECRRFLREHRCLVVIDGLQSKDDWDLIKAAFLPDSTNACIVVITNEASVARYCVHNKKHQVVNVKGLKADTALNLFQEIARSTKDFNAGDMDLLKLIIAKCGGMPRIIASIAENIVENGRKLFTSRATYLLKNINDDFMGKVETDTNFHSLRDLFSWMQFYFDACSDTLKPCIFYLSVFPAGHVIKRRRLLRRWIAECYSRDTSSSTAEENGEKLLSELANLSIIQHKTRGVHCQVNGFFHEYIISRPMEDNLVFALEGSCSLNAQRAGQHLTIRSSWDRDIIVFTSMDLSRLRSLTVFGKWMSFFISTDMRLLRVLDLTDTSHATNDDLEQIGKVMPRLKFLSLRGCMDITQLPESLCGLSQLQTLDVRHTSIVMLPPAIVKLKKLQYVRAGTTISSNECNDTGMTCVPLSDVEQTTTPPEDGNGMAATMPAQIVDVQTSSSSASCMPHSSVSSWFSKLCGTPQHDNGGVKVPLGIGKLTAMHTLGVVNVNVAGGRAILRELRKLTQLRKLGVSGINRGNSHEFYSAISGHAHLESLSVRLDKDKEGLFFRLDDITQPPKTLKSLKLYGDAQILPSWLMHHENLKKGNLEMNVSTEEDIDVIETLRCGDIFHRLCVKPIQDAVLRVGKLEDGSTRPGWSGKEFRVKVLEIDCTSKLEINFGCWVHLYVERLMVRCSSGSSLQVFGLWFLRGLKEVWLKGSYGEELKQDLQRQIDMFPEKPVLKLQEPRSS